MMKNNEKRRLFDAFLLTQKNKPKGLYVHFPFCSSKCYYCDFLSYQNQEKRMKPYLEALKREIVIYNTDEKIPVDTIYLGGGTPSYIPVELMAEIMKSIKDNFEVSSESEITIEINPEHLTDEAINSYLSMGINRASVGVQSFNDRLLKVLGRSHDSETAVSSILNLRKFGFKNISIDIINAIPTQNIEESLEDIKKAIELSPKHLSLYSLILEPNTHMSRLVNIGQLELVDEETDREMFYAASELLSKSGYDKYEISNFARPGFESIHNTKYWKLDEYIGLGLGSSSFYNSYRYSNIVNINEYQKLSGTDKPIEERELMDYDSLKTDYILMGLRLVEGINLKEYIKIFGVDFYSEYKKYIDLFIREGHMFMTDERIAFTPSGMDISNRFFVEIV